MNFFFRYKANNNKNNSLNKFNSNAINSSNTANFANSTHKLKTLDFLNDSTNMELNDKLMHRTNSNNNNKEKIKQASQNDDDELGENEPLKESNNNNNNNNNNNRAKKRVASLTDKNADVDDKEKSNQAKNEPNVNNEINDKTESNEPVDDKTNLVAAKIEKHKLDSAARAHTSRRSSKNSNSISRSFIRRLLSCGGSCTGNRRTSNSLLFNTNNNNNNNNNNASHGGLITKSKASDPTRKSSESSLSLDKLHYSAENSNLNETQQFKSDTNLNQKEEYQHETIENSYENISYESIIDKFVNYKPHNENYKHPFSSNNLIEPNNFAKSNDLISNKQQDQDHHLHASPDHSKDSNDRNLKLVLPVFKLNDNYLPSPNAQTKKEFHPSNTDDSVSEFEDEEEEITEIDEEDEEDEDEEYDDDGDDEQNAAFIDDANYHPNIESDNNDMDANGEYDDNESKKNKKAPNSSAKQDKKTPSKSLGKQAEQSAKQSDLKSSKLVEDLKGGTSNRQTPSSTTTTSHKSNECYDLFPKNTMASSSSNFSIKNNFESELNDENMNSADNGANYLVHLISCKHKYQNSSTKNLTSDLCPSIGPLSKSPSPIFLVQKTNDSETEKASDTTNFQHTSKSEEIDEINEITKVKSWLIETDNHYHHHHRQEAFKDSSNLSEAKSENTDSAIDVNSSCSNSNVSKSSSNKLVRIRWESFNKYYQTNYQQANSSEQNYHISSMSLEQLMSLRKLALLQFSKLLERQHSTMSRFFYKNKDIAEFRRVYDTVNSISSKAKTSISNGETSKSSNENYESLIIENKKIIHQLGAPNERNTKRSSKGSSFRSVNETSIVETKAEKSVVISTDSSATSNKVMEKVVTINTKSFSSTPPTVFGTSLNAIMQHTGQPLPNKILEAMKYLRKIAQNEIGVFRKNGVKTRINKLRESINRNESIDYQASEYTPFDIADTVKLYFRELPECLITNKLSEILLSNYDKIRPEERKVILQQVMLLVPDENRLVLQTLLLFLNEIAKFHKTNQMNRSNLAVCFSPVIFRFNLEKKSKLKQTIPPVVATTTTTTAALTVISNTVETTNVLKKNLSNLKLADPIDEDTNVNITKSRSSANTLNVTKPLLQSNSQPELCEKKNSNLTNKQDESLSIEKINSDNLKTDLASTLAPTTPVSAPSLFSISETTLVTTPVMTAVKPVQTATPQTAKPNKRKYSEKFKSSIVNFGAELNKSNKFDLTKGNFENMNKVIQLCVSDMIKYSVELFNVPVENFEKFKLTFSNSDPLSLDSYYDLKNKSLKKADFFVNSIKPDKNYWYYMDKFEDVSIYFCKNENSTETKQDDSIMLPELTLNTNHNLLPTSDASLIQANSSESHHTNSNTSLPHSISSTIVTSTNFLTLMPQKFETFSDKLKLWKCCTLIKQKNVTLEKIVNRIKNERHLWDDDFVEGRVVEVLDENTELYCYSISFMPPHPQKEFFEIRHASKQNITNIDTVILTSTSVKHKESSSNIRSNMMISKYVIEKLIATDTTTTFKITHYVKLDYKGFTLEFYNKTFGYMMARLLYNLTMSFKSL